ncbi:unnamed protein product (macronuclear) [Paramecium tetraurelia]|uniref:Phosphatidylcholine transfer protein n=1 Tax=Paramecium tetraurelia TaxID=5888 RepID=A0CMA3_PARTE|nr:uncharacterized protein GSPATT00008399001 [Paramecium tetraurelia]CAK71920.1 unnamed protein product [Paramecium tetraurelia]|eukprot:XP_001439317.1 hypothetical protein (macronuclear) [Paramecium tetraurelia strain d4-2]
MQNYLQQVQQMLKIQKFQKMWNYCCQFYEFGILHPTLNILLGIEFSALATTPSSFIQLLLSKHFYLPQNYLTPTQKKEFDEMLQKSDEFDQRNLGTVLGMIVLGAIGFFVFGFALVGGIGGGVLGVVGGHQVGKRIKKTLQNKQDVKEIDIYDIKVRTILKWAYLQKKQYCYNMNLQRFVIEKILTEIKIALHLKYFSTNNQTQLQNLLKKTFLFLNQDLYLCSIELSLLLLEEQLKILRYYSQQDQNVCLNQEEMKLLNQQINQRNQLEISVLKAIDNVIKPVVTLFSNQLPNYKQPQIIKKAREFLYSNEIVQLSKQFPDPQMSIYYIKMLSSQLNLSVNTTNLKLYVQQQNFRNLENVGQDIQCIMQKQNANQNRLQEEEIKINIEQVQIEEQQCDVIIQNNESQIELEKIVEQNPQDIKLKLHSHPNKIYFTKIDPKCNINSTPYQSYEDIINNPEKEKQFSRYPQHYCQQSIKKFDLFLNLIHEPTDKWDLAINNKDAQIYKTMKEGSDNVFIKGFCIIKNTSLELALRVVYDIKLRREWDKLLRDFQIIKTESEDIDILAYYVQPPISLVTPREWVQRRILRYDFPEKGQITLIFYSIDYPQHPVNRNRIRAHTEISSMIFEAYEQNNVKISICSNNDIKGYIPKMIVNRASASGPIDWFKSLQEACNKYR